MEFRFRLTTAFTWCLLIASSSLLTTTSAARFEIRNEISPFPGRNRNVTVTCWSTTDQLGTHELVPGESRSWSFKPVYIKIPFLYTVFHCTFITSFGSPYGQTATVFAGERMFRWQCDNPDEEECIWVVKREGLFLRRISRDYKVGKVYEDELSMAWIGGTNYFPIQL